MPNTLDFQRSITGELEIIRNRVRDLIGNRHWGEEGRYKEAVLKNILKRFLPKNISIGTGFIVSALNGEDISRQLDIILYDNTYPVLFSEGDFIITTSKNVRGIIEVKSSLNVTGLRNTINQFEQSIEMLPHNLITPFFQRFGRRQTRVFFGVFAFEYSGTVSSGIMHNALSNSRGLINHFSLGTNIFVRKWKMRDGDRLQPPVNAQNDFYNIYDIDHLSFSYFISNLIDIVSGGLDDRYLHAYPIIGTKELYRRHTVVLRHL